MQLQAPFPWFGGKSKVAGIAWERFGDVRNYVEPFAGSLAVLLGRPCPFKGTEAVNDLDGYIANFWRALKAVPDEVAEWADWPVNENDLHARHTWLVERKDSLRPRLEGDPDWFDAKVAGWWVWGIACRIGGEFCSGKGPWRVVERDGVRQLAKEEGDAGQGVNRQLPYLGSAGIGVQRKRIALGTEGRGLSQGDTLLAWMESLSERLRRVRVCCGDWSRGCRPSLTTRLGSTAVFLDPPYSEAAGRDPTLYNCESSSVAHDCRRWCLERGADPLMRIALCGYEGEHEELERAGWTVYAWKANGGYANQGDNAGRANARRERIWFSPHCLKPASATPELFPPSQN